MLNTSELTNRGFVPCPTGNFHATRVWQRTYAGSTGVVYFHIKCYEYSEFPHPTGPHASANTRWSLEVDLNPPPTAGAPPTYGYTFYIHDPPSLATAEATVVAIYKAIQCTPVGQDPGESRSIPGVPV
jgi:hypothetical protein